MRAMELKIPIEIVFDDVNSVLDELGKLQKYKLCEGDDMALVDVDDVADVLTRHVMAREAKEPCGMKEGWIPCSERLPEANGRYLVTRGLNACGALWNRVYIINYTDLMGLKSGRIWWDGNVGKSDFEQIADVIAWMPLPKPYGGESE